MLAAISPREGVNAPPMSISSSNNPRGERLQLPRSRSFALLLQDKLDAANSMRNPNWVPEEDDDEDEKSGKKGTYAVSFEVRLRYL